MLKNSFIVILALVMLLSITVVAQAAQTASWGGATLFGPDPTQVNCTPTDTIYTTGIGDRPTRIYLFVHNPATNNMDILFTAEKAGGEWNMAFPYPAITGEMRFEARVDFLGLTNTEKMQIWWKVTCDGGGGGAGCTPGYWKNHPEDWPMTGYSWTQSFSSAFGFILTPPGDMTLGEAVWLGGGGNYALYRHGTAALLNASHPAVDFPYTVAEVKALVLAKNQNALVAANELGCTIP